MCMVSRPRLVWVSMEPVTLCESLTPCLLLPPSTVSFLRSISPSLSFTKHVWQSATARQGRGSPSHLPAPPPHTHTHTHTQTQQHKLDLRGLLISPPAWQTSHQSRGGGGGGGGRGGGAGGTDGRCEEEERSRGVRGGEGGASGRGEEAGTPGDP